MPLGDGIAVKPVGRGRATGQSPVSARSETPPGGQMMAPDLWCERIPHHGKSALGAEGKLYAHGWRQDHGNRRDRGVFGMGVEALATCPSASSS